MVCGLSDGLRLALIGLVPLAIFLLGLVLFRDVLLPFLVGMAAAYLLDPAADRLQRLGLGRTVATLTITGSFVIVLLVVLVVILPPLATQAADLARDLPGYLEQLRRSFMPWLTGLVARTELADSVTTDGLIERFSGRAMEFLGTALSGVLQSGLFFLNLLSLIFVTPVVTFYLIRDWDRMMARLRSLIPPDALPTAERLAHEVDEVMAGVIRGQGLVCLFLATFYSLGLWAVGLQYGLIIGLLTGLFSFIPYIGMAVGFFVGMVVAAFQFQDLLRVALVAAVFLVGQFIEGNLVTPRLVGARIRVHPVWLIFAVLAGAALFGLLGAFLAVPVAGVLGVFVRFALERYRASALYDPKPAP
jgi:predicted PurR-regulated permease PerM